MTVLHTLPESLRLQSCASLRVPQKNDLRITHTASLYEKEEASLLHQSVVL